VPRQPTEFYDGRRGYRKKNSTEGESPPRVVSGHALRAVTDRTGAKTS